MENQEAIDYLNNLQTGMFCTVNIPLISNEKIPITVIYMGKDKEGRYNFVDTGRFIMSKEFIEQKSITIDKSFDKNVAMKINAKIHKENNKKLKKERAR